MNTEIKKTQILGIDYFKMFAAIMIVAWHCSLISQLGRLSPFLSTIFLPTWAVPFFFCTGGFFLNKHIQKYGNIKSTLKKLIILYIMWTVVYSPINIIIPILNEAFSIKTYLKDFFFYGSNSHLWFIVAMIYVYILVKYINNKILLCLSTIGILYGLLGSSYYQIGIKIPIISDYLINFNQFDKVRRIFSLALPYITLGFFISKNDNYLKKNIISRNNSCFMIVLICYIFEIYIVYHFKLERDIFNSIFLILLVFFIFLISLTAKFQTNIRSLKWANLCRSLSAFIYFVHILIIQFLASILKDSMLYSPLLLFCLTITISIILGYLIIRLNNPILNKLIL